MQRVTRRRWLTAAAAAGVATYAAAGDPLGHDETKPEFRADGAGTPRELLQQRHLPNLPLVTHAGERVRFYDDLVKDKKVILTFVSSRAAGDSGRVTENLAALQRFFGRRVGSDIFMYSIARTPDRDTPAVLKRWARSTGAGPGWRFLTGDAAVLEQLRHRLGFASPDPAEDADPAYAVGLLRHGVEPQMRWAHCQSQAAPRVLAHSMLLDFGDGPTDTVKLQTGSRLTWNCRLLAAAID